MRIVSNRVANAIALLSASSMACADGAGPVMPARLEVTNGDAQIAQIGTLLPTPIVVTVVDGDGRPMRGVKVEWRAVGDDRVIPLDPATDEEGHAEARWVLGKSEGQRSVEATLPGLEPAIFTAVAESDQALPFGELFPIDVPTYDGSHQVVHPDYAATPDGAFGQPFHLAITPYPHGDQSFENPSLFDGARRDLWSLTNGVPNPVVLPDTGYLSDPDLVYVPELGELWLYYRQVIDANLVMLVRTTDGRQWTAPLEVARAPNHELVSPSIVRRAADDWWMFAVNTGTTGCGAAATTVDARRSADGLHWGTPARVALKQPGLSPWHIDVQWIASRQVFWAVYNAKTEADCATPAVYIAESADGLVWEVLPNAVLTRGATPTLQDIVYRTTFEYDPVTDAITFWYSGARYERGDYVWGAVVQRRHRAEVFAATGALAVAVVRPPPAPLVDWP